MQRWFGRVSWRSRVFTSCVQGELSGFPCSLTLFFNVRCVFEARDDCGGRCLRQRESRLTRGRDIPARLTGRSGHHRIDSMGEVTTTIFRAVHLSGADFNYRHLCRFFCSFGQLRRQQNNFFPPLIRASVQGRICQASVPSKLMEFTIKAIE